MALVPDAMAKLRPAGIEVLVERRAGQGAWFPDSAYAGAGATVVGPAELFAAADVTVTVTEPSAATVDKLNKGQAIIGMLAPLTDPELAAASAARGVTAISLDHAAHAVPDPADGRAQLPGECGRLQGGCHRRGRVRPVLPAADHRGRHRPARPGAGGGTGVAGGIGTARRLGAVVATTCGPARRRRSSRSAPRSSS